MKKVCVVTGTRAEYGLLKPVIDKIHKAKDLELQLVATGMHLSPEFGMTYKEIEADGYTVTEKVEMLLSSDTGVGITKSMAVALMGFGECFDRLKPDMVVILGDRYEMLMVASAAMVAKIPIAHIHGGEITEEEWERGLLNDELPIDTDYTSDDESFSEQFDSLFKKKMTLEKEIEGVRDDRRKLHAKHLKSFF